MQCERCTRYWIEGFNRCDCPTAPPLTYDKALARIAELEQMVRKYADTCSCVQMMLRDSPVRCILCTKALALLQPEAGKEVVT